MGEQNLENAYTEYANYKDGANIQRELIKISSYVAVHLPTVFFPPGEDTALTIATAHEHFDILAIHTLGLGAISYSVGIFEVDTVLMEKMHSLLLVVWITPAFERHQKSVNIH
jgi:hypothetical protein